MVDQGILRHVSRERIQNWDETLCTTSSLPGVILMRNDVLGVVGIHTGDNFYLQQDNCGLQLAIYH